MARKKKDGRFINYYIDRLIYERLERYADDKAQPITAALERILDDYLTRYETEIASIERYCPNCHVLVRNTRCHICDKRWLEEPTPDDYCFLTEKDSVWSGVLEDCLRQNAIPYLTQNTMGAGLTAKLGTMLEQTKFYVCYAFYYKAKELEAELFSSASIAIDEEDNV